MKIWEIVNFSDKITVLANDFDHAVGAALLLGRGSYGVEEYDVENPRSMPPFIFVNLPVIAAWLGEAFPELRHPSDPQQALDKFMASLDNFRLADILRSAQVCSGQDREAYQKALEAIDDAGKKQTYSRWWKEQRRTSMNDIVARAWTLADRLEQLERNKRKEESDGTNLTV